MTPVLKLLEPWDCRDPPGVAASRVSMETRVRMGFKAEVGGWATLDWREILARLVGGEHLAWLGLTVFLAGTEPRAMLGSRVCLETGDRMGTQVSQDCQGTLASLVVRARSEGRATLDILDPLEMLDPQDPGAHQELTACQVPRVPLASPNRKDLPEPRVVRGQQDLRDSLESRGCRAGRGPGGRMVTSSWVVRGPEVSQVRPV